MNYSLIAQGLRLIADGIDAAPEHAPVTKERPAVTAKAPDPGSEQQSAAAAAAAATVETTTQTAEPAMSYDDFTVSLRAVASKMPPGSFGTVVGPLLKEYGAAGVQELDPHKYRSFLDAAAARVREAVGGAK